MPNGPTPEQIPKPVGDPLPSKPESEPPPGKPEPDPSPIKDPQAIKPGLHPHGWQFAAVNLGWLDVGSGAVVNGVDWVGIIDKLDSGLRKTRS